MVDAKTAMLELSEGNWENLYNLSEEWLATNKDNPFAKFLLMLSCSFINPPKIAKFVHIIEELEKNLSAGKVFSLAKTFQDQEYRRNPYVQGARGCLVAYNDVKESLAILETAIKENPKCPELYYWLGLSWSGSEKAVEYYKKALEIRPNFAAALYSLAITYFKLGQIKGAEKSFKSAIVFSHSFAEAHYQLGSLYQHHLKGKTDIAREHFQKAVEIDPEGEIGRDAKAFLEGKSEQPRLRVEDRSKGLPSLPKGVIIGISVFSIFLIGGPIAIATGSHNPAIGIGVGIVVYIVLSAFFGRKN